VIEKPLGAHHRRQTIKAERTLLCESKLLAADAVGPGRFERPEERRSDQADENEVVEVSRLERRILAIVREA
jgi:hypothetical protein